MPKQKYNVCVIEMYSEDEFHGEYEQELPFLRRIGASIVNWTEVDKSQLSRLQQAVRYHNNNCKHLDPKHVIVSVPDKTQLEIQTGLLDNYIECMKKREIEKEEQRQKREERNKKRELKQQKKAEEEEKQKLLELAKKFKQDHLVSNLKDRE